MIELYLANLARRLRGPAAWRSRLLAEARDHLLEAIDRYEAAGMSHEDAEAQALRRFGEARVVARAANRSLGLWGWCASAIEPWTKEAAMVPRVLGAAFALTSVYYLAWYAAHPGATGSLLAALVVIGSGVSLVLQGRPAQPRAVWFHGVYPSAPQGWLIVVLLLGLTVGAFIGVDSNAHSVSDTLGTFVPLLSVIAAIAGKLVYGLGEPAARAAS